MARTYMTVRIDHKPRMTRDSVLDTAVVMRDGSEQTLCVCDAREAPRLIAALELYDIMIEDKEK